MTLQRKPKNALLVLENGEIFEGYSFGANGHTVGEVVFNTSMTGYQEILTDPSYCKQLITLTYPHIGNTGVNSEDVESDNIWAAGLIIRDVPALSSNFRQQQTLPDYLVENNIVAISGIDTRHLTNILREQGTQKGCIITSDSLDTEKQQVVQQALELAGGFAGLKGMDLAHEVTTKDSYQWGDGSWSLAVATGLEEPAKHESKYHVVAYDFGVKHNILRMLVDRECQLTVVPANTPASEVLALKPDGIFLSNGPGDPEPCTYAIDAIREFLSTGIPLFGICLGHQLLGLAVGGSTKKMKFGHHGANHPVQNLDTKTVFITSQNHGFEVDEQSLPANVKVTHRSLFDNSLQGIELIDYPAFSFQGHPEASPGPHETAPLFDHFIELMNTKTNGGNTNA